MTPARPTSGTVSVPPAVRIQWTGSDPDGPGGRPVAYRWRVFHRNDPELSLATILADPDTLRRRYAPTYAGWDSLPGDSTGLRLHGLPQLTDCLFAVIGMDDRGETTTGFSLATNLLHLLVREPDRLMLGIRSATFQAYLFPPAPPPFPVVGRLDRPLRIEWFGAHPEPLDPASRVFAFRWAMDPDTLLAPGSEDPGPGWTGWSTAHTRLDLAPFRGVEAQRSHRLVVEVMDEVGFYGRGILLLQPLTPARDRDLLVVNDTRFRPDRASHLPIAGTPWPWAAELDTFLFARGGVPWRFYPEGTLSTPGIFAGYDFDTLGTRTGVVDLTVSLDVLSRYRHVVWITDAAAAANVQNGTGEHPMSALADMTRGSRHTLAEFVRGGGQLWLVGGGAARAAADWFNWPLNDVGGRVYASPRELFQGSLMFDQVRWRSEVRVGKPASFTVTRGGDLVRGGIERFDALGLPEVLEPRAPDTDPVPPEREAVPSHFYGVSPHLEWISQPNHVRTDPVDSTGTTRRGSLDTLMVATLGAPDPGTRPCMTIASGPNGGRVVFSGFDLWSWRRSHCVLLVDAVLEGVWGLDRQPLPTVPLPQRSTISSSQRWTGGHPVSSNE